MFSQTACKSMSDSDWDGEYSPRDLQSPYHDTSNWEESDRSFIDDISAHASFEDERFPSSPAAEASGRVLAATAFGGVSAVHSEDFDYTTEAVTIVSEIDRRIHLARLCVSEPSIFGVHSQRKC